ncbi:MAG: FAD-dependent oxidoreductase [Planctomycetota bacterium]
MDLLTASEPANTFSSSPNRDPAHDLDAGHESQRRLVIVGMGMAGFGLCDRLVRSGSMDRYTVTLIGEEREKAYDRVNLSGFFAGRTEQELLLADDDWYARHHIRAVTGRRVVSIDRDQRIARDSEGEEHQYDELVLATGSRAWVPPIEGVPCDGVFVYRTLADLRTIKDYVARIGAGTGAVIGGGLLGLEAAKVLTDLGVRASVIEMAPGLMPKQLDADGARRLKDHVEETGVDVHLVRRTQSVERLSDGTLRIHFSNARPLHVDTLIIAAGIRPNDQLAADCGLKIGPRGGFVIDETLSTSDPHIRAIGECVSFREHLFGLVAPCYRMADVLAERLSGQGSVFEGADESAELKLMGVQVATLGQALGEAAGVTTLTYHDEDGYRKLLLEQGRIVGASCVGSWPELPQVRQAIAAEKYLWPWQRARFRRIGSPWAPGGEMPVQDWPGDAVVCSCLGISKATVLESIEQQRATTPNDAESLVENVAGSCGASTACGSCKGLVTGLCGGDQARTSVPGATPMLIASVAALVGVVVVQFLDPIAYADSVQSSWRQMDVLWRNDLARQITGFSLLGVTVVGMVFSLRKRVSNFRFGSYGVWRAVHGVLGTLALLAVLLHTGLRLGSNLNFMLGSCFMLTILLGSIAGITSSLENRVSGNTAMLMRLWRGRLAKLHLWVTWPLPVLIALHILSFYWFSD